MKEVANRYVCPLNIIGGEVLAKSNLFGPKFDS